MPSVFISYAQADRAVVEGIEAGLARAGVAIWRDLYALRAGQRWPEALGEAIAAQENFLLCWSQAASASGFVRLEWNTALALGKPIIPCRLDETPLPPSLSALQAVDARQAGALARILAGLHAPPPPPVSRRWPWRLLVFGLLLGAGVLLGLKLWQGGGSVELSGVVWDGRGQAVAGAEVAIVETGQTATTGPTGAFHFTLRGEPGKSLSVQAKTPGHASPPEYFTPGAQVHLTLQPVR